MARAKDWGDLKMATDKVESEATRRATAEVELASLKNKVNDFDL